MRRVALILAVLGLTGCVSDNPDVAVYDAPAYYDDGSGYEPYVYDYYTPGPRAYVGAGYYYGRPYPYYIGGGGYRGRDRHDHDYRDRDRHDGPDRDRSRESRSGRSDRTDRPSPRGDSEPARVRTRTGFEKASDRPAARPSPGNSQGRQGRR